MRFERRGSVIKHLQIKGNYLRSKNPVGHEEIRPVLMVLSGVFRGVYSGGCLTALHKSGYKDSFDHAVAVSTGGPGVLYFLGDNPELGVTIYWEECLSGKFIPVHFLDDAKTLLSQLGIKTFGDRRLMDIEYLCKVFRGLEGKKAANLEAFMRSRTNCQVAVVRCHDGEGMLLNTKKVADPIEAFRAAIALPGVSNGKVSIDGIEYEDGVGAMPCDTELIVRELNPTDILVMANRTEDDHTHFVEQLLTRWATNDECDKLRQDFATREERFKEGINFLRKWDGRWGIIWADDTISAIERDAQKLQKAARDAEAWMIRLIKEETR